MTTLGANVEAEISGTLSVSHRMSSGDSSSEQTSISVVFSDRKSRYICRIDYIINVNATTDCNVSNQADDGDEFLVE